VKPGLITIELILTRRYRLWRKRAEETRPGKDENPDEEDVGDDKLHFPCNRGPRLVALSPPTAMGSGHGKYCDEIYRELMDHT